MIKELTKEQETMIPKFIEKWVNNVSAENDREGAAVSISALYKSINKLEPPKFVFAKSPQEAVLLAAIYDIADVDLSNDAACQKAIADYSKKVSKKALSEINENVLYSQWYSSWCGWFDFAKEIGVNFDKEKYDLLHAFCRSVFACISFTDVCFVIDKPNEVHFENGRIHNSTGPSVKFSDGYCMYSLNGVRVPKWVVETPPEQIDPVALLKEKNAEVRRELVRKIGVKRICEKLDTTTIDKMTWKTAEKDPGLIKLIMNKLLISEKEASTPTECDYELLELKIEGMNTPVRYLKMKNPSIDTYHIEGVPGNIKTCEEALKWRVGGAEWNPSQLT